MGLSNCLESHGGLTALPQNPAVDSYFPRYGHNKRAHVVPTNYHRLVGRYLSAPSRRTCAILVVPTMGWKERLPILTTMKIMWIHKTILQSAMLMQIQINPCHVFWKRANMVPILVFQNTCQWFFLSLRLIPFSDQLDLGVRGPGGPVPTDGLESKPPHLVCEKWPGLMTSGWLVK